MGRKYFQGPKADHMNMTVTKPHDRAVLEEFNACAKAKGMPVQRALLVAAENYVRANK